MNIEKSLNTGLLYGFSEILGAIDHSIKSDQLLGFFLMTDSIEICISRVERVIEHPELADKREMEIVLEEGRVIRFYEISAVCLYDDL